MATTDTNTQSAPLSVSSPPRSLVLNIGVIDIPYSNAEQPEKVPQAKRGKKNKPIKPKGSSATKTTGDVATILEEEYAVLDTFTFARLPDIALALEDSIAGALENLMMGAPPQENPMASAEGKITQMMKDFISTKQIESMGIEGAPTQAALNGVNHRLKHPYAKANPRRPSFMDTTLYWQSLKAWF